MRGRRSHGKPAETRIRNTPAYAGKTSRWSHPSPSLQKHPRVCGEDYETMLNGIASAETPPRMRGRLQRQLVSQTAPGNTPAYAGKTPETACGNSRQRKHPRVCGEDDLLLQTSNQNQETPPRMRGRLSLCAERLNLGGNTPAYAGKTRRRHKAR